MPDTIKAILIDPFACEVRHIALPRGDDQLEAYYAALSHETMAVDIFEAVRAAHLLGNDCIFIDEEGSFKGAERYFMHVGFHSPLIGKGLIVGADSQGRTISAQTPIDRVKRCVAFLKVEGGALHQTREPWTPPQ